MGNFGTGTASKGGVQTLDDASYFADPNSAGTITDPSSVTALFPGAILNTYDASIGGDQGGQEFVAGADLSWRSARMFPGKLSVYNTNTFDDCSVFVRAKIPNSNCITMQNDNRTGYSAIRWCASTISGSGEKGAMGFGNSQTSFYPGINYLEDNGNQSGFYFVAQGNLFCGLQALTGDFIVFPTGTTDPTTGPAIFLRQTGDIELLGGINSHQGINATTQYTILGNLVIDGSNFYYDSTGTQILSGQQPNIANATGTLADATTKINAILALLGAHGLMA